MEETVTKPGRRKRLLFVGGGAMVVAIIVTVAVWPGPKEPEYQGKKLSEWLEMYAQDTRQGLQRMRPIDFTPEAVNANADICRVAIRRMGTNALPYMVHWLHYERPRWRTVLSAAYVKLPRRFQRKGMAERIAGSDPYERVRGAYWGFWALGSEAAPAIPALVALTHDGDRAVSLAAVDCLGFVGPAATMHLVRMTNGLDKAAYWRVNSAIFSSKSWSFDPETGKRTLITKE